LRKEKAGGTLAAEPIGPGGPRPAHFLALVIRPYLWPAHFLGDVNFSFLYIAILTGEKILERPQTVINYYF